MTRTPVGETSCLPMFVNWLSVSSSYDLKLMFDR